MHARELVEVAGLVALNGPLLVAGTPAPGAVYLEQYWATSKCRFESWSRALRCGATLADRGAREKCDQWIEIRSALDEIFTSEMLTRVWTAVLVARDRRHRSDTAEPLARSVLTAHLEARRRALALLLDREGFSTAQAAALDRLRRRVERWTDVLLGGLLHLWDVREFAIDAERVEDFAADLAHERSHASGRQAWRMTLVSLRGAFQSGLSPIAANPDANARITASILGSFPGELFDSTGVFQSLWMMRLAANASDAQGMITDLLGPSIPALTHGAQSKPRRRRI
jgi:hypothetical protein